MDADAGEAHDWSTLPPRQLIEHIVSSHHRYLRAELPRSTRARPPGRRRAALRQGGEGGGPGDFPFGSIDNPVRVMATGPDHVGELLETLRRTTADYAVADDGCASYRAIYEGLVALEHDTHVPVREENNVLFPAFVQSG